MNLAEKLLSDDVLTVGHLAVEDHACERRDARIGLLGCANGIVCCEKDGTRSNIIRIGTRDAIELALRAMLTYIKESAADPNSRDVGKPRKGQ